MHQADYFDAPHEDAMPTHRTLSNHYGESWQVEHYESERLTHIGGYLITYQDTSRLIFSSHLSLLDKQRCQEHLLEHLTRTPLGTNEVILWHPDDEH